MRWSGRGQAKTAGSGRTLERLLAAVHADPDDLDTRLVYADALSEAGDPRGEFIALQCASGTAGPAQPEWLGRLAPILEHCVYVCGFLYSARVKKVARPKIAATVGDPIWSTVTELWFDESIGGVAIKNGDVVRGPTVVAAQLLRHPIMRALRSVRGIDGDVLTTLCAHDVALPFRSIRARTYPLLERVADTSRWCFERTARDVLALAPSLPHLRELELHGYPGGAPDLEWLLHAPIANRLERLRLENFGGTIDHWIATVRGTPIPVVEVDTARFRGGDDLEIDAKRFSPWQSSELDAALARVSPNHALRRLEIKR